MVSSKPAIWELAFQRSHPGISLGAHLPPGVVIGGIAVDLPDGYNATAMQTINDATETMITTNPFQDNPQIPQLGEG